MLIFIWYEVKNKTQANEAVSQYTAAEHRHNQHSVLWTKWECENESLANEAANQHSKARSKVDPSSQWLSKVATAPPGVHLTKQHVIMLYLFAKP